MPNNLKVFGSKQTKQDSQNRLMSPMPGGKETYLSLITLLRKC